MKSKIAILFSSLVISAASLGVVFAIYSKNKISGSYLCGMEVDNIGDFVRIDGGIVQSDDVLASGYGGVKKVYVSPFLIQINEVTNLQFSEFVAETGYITEAQRNQGSARFSEGGVLDSPLSWWTLDEEATWFTPEGKGSNLGGKENYPVVHVTLNDARAYAEWAGGRIPTEIEWEYAASLGLFDPQNPESGIRTGDGKPRANIWNGTFPIFNTEEDGFKTAAPVGCYEPNLIGAYDMIGNVWEWTESRFNLSDPTFTIKGGSYLCSINYCRRYFTTSREGLEENFSTAHVGFRIVKDL